MLLSRPLPYGAIWCRALPLAPLHQQHAADEVRSLLEKGATEQVLDSPPAFSFSPAFVIPKRSGILSLILISNRINRHVPSVHVRMDTHGAPPCLSSKDWAVSIDLKDAYFHIPILPDSRNLLGFQACGKTYRF